MLKLSNMYNYLCRTSQPMFLKDIRHFLTYIIILCNRYIFFIFYSNYLIKYYLILTN